ncbi:hypothetical protein HQ545_01605 [Candidatus Woesearchaeota archaeon]|nr:hypothetical protein [Candidatus Woesearchaeota archaeon]
MYLQSIINSEEFKKATAMCEQELMEEKEADLAARHGKLAFQTGQKVDEYTIKECIASTNMSRIWLAEDNRAKECVIKQQNLDTAFLNYHSAEREALLHMEFEHPNLVNSMDPFVMDTAGRTMPLVKYVSNKDLRFTPPEGEGVIHIPMELLATDVTNYVGKPNSQGRLSNDFMRKLQEFMYSSAKLINTFHENELVLFDFNHSQCMFDNNGILKVFDLGSVDDECGAIMEDDILAATPQYMPPHQQSPFYAEDPYIHSSLDVYALGVSALELMLPLVIKSDEKLKKVMMMPDKRALLKFVESTGNVPFHLINTIDLCLTSTHPETHGTEYEFSAKKLLDRLESMVEIEQLEKPKTGRGLYTHGRYKDPEYR